MKKTFKDLHKGEEFMYNGDECVCTEINFVTFKNVEENKLYKIEGSKVIK